MIKFKYLETVLCKHEVTEGEARERPMEVKAKLGVYAIAVRGRGSHFCFIGPLACGGC